MSGFVMLVTGITIYVYLFIFSTGTEPALKEMSIFKPILPLDQRMAFVTASNLFIISIVLLLLASKKKINFNLAHILIIPVSLSSYFVPVTYLLGIYSVHSLENVAVALTTGIALCGVCIAVLLIKPDTWLLKVFTSRNMGGIISRKLLLPLLILPVVIAWFRIRGEHAGLFTSDEGVAFVSLTYVFCFVMLVWLASRSLNTIDRKKQESEELLRRSYDELEIRIQERTSELLELNKLLDAEIAERKRAEEKLKNINADLELRVNDRTKEYQNAVKEIERYSQKMEILSDVSSRLLASDNPQLLVNELCNRVMKFLNCDVFFNFIVNENESRLYINAFAGIDETEAHKIEWLDFGVAVCGCVARDGKRIIAENIPTTPDPRTDLIRTFGIKAYACHPLLSGNRVIGTLSFGTRNRLTYSDEEIALMKTVADQVAVAMSRVENERKLKESEDRFRTIAELLPVQIVITRSSDGVVLFTNEMFNSTFGFKKYELFGRKTDDLYYTSADYINMLNELREAGKSVHKEVRVKRADGSDFWILESTQKITYGMEAAYLSASVDISESKSTKDQLLQINRTLNSLGKSSHAMMHSSNELQYLNEVCRIIIEDCGHKMVWIGYAESDEKKSVKPVASYGFDENYINQLDITWEDNQKGRGPTGTAIRTGKPAICRDMHTDPSFEPWRCEAIKRGYASSVVFPLKTGEKTFGAISIYSKEPDPFSEVELSLLSDLSTDLSYGITNIRLRMAEREASGLIKESEEKYRMLFETMIEGFAFHEIIIDEKGDACDYKFLSINPAFEKQTGLKASDIIGKNVTEVLPAIEKKWIESYGRVALTGESIEFENYLSELDSYFRVSSFCPKKGYFAVIFENITDRRRAEKEVKEAKEKLDLALENAKIGLWEWDIMRNELFLDERMENLFRLKHSYDKKKFRFFEEMIYEEDLLHFRNAIDRAINENIPFDTIFRINSDNGELNHISSKAIVVRDKSDLPVKMTGVCFDISDMKKGTEQALFTLNENLIRSNRELEQFAYVASHDLQEPLRMVSSFTQLLSKRYKDKLDSDANEFIQYAVDGASRMQVLINDLLEYSRIETKGKALSPIDMHDALGYAVKNLSFKIKEKHALISNDELPVVFADGGQMTQLFQNLLSNALKFCTSSPKIYITSAEENGHYIFSVRDNGIGIEPQYFNKIFQIFQRLHGKEEYGGTGIGLSICRRIVDRHGGKIWLESKQNEGSTFYFTIPKK
jgi:PAS domain S-box-containing protein